MSRSRTRGVLLAGVTAVLWGTVPIAGKLALTGITASLLSSIRLLGSALCLAVVLRLRRQLRFRPPHRLIYPAGLALGANYVLYMEGLDRSDPGVAQVLIQTAPLFLIGLSILFLGERPHRKRLAGIALAAVGVLLVSWSPRAGETAPALLGAGTGLILLSALAWAIYGVCHKRLGEDHASGHTMVWIFLFSGLAAAPGAFFESGPVLDSPVELAAIAYLIANSFVAYTCFGESLRHIDASLASVICTLGPVVTLALVAASNAWGDSPLPPETLTAAKLAGAVAVIVGVILAVARRRVPR